MNIEEIAAGLDIAIEDAPGLLGIGPMSPFGSEHAGTLDELRHRKPVCWPSSLYRIACPTFEVQGKPGCAR